MRIAEKENLAVFYMRLPRETERLRGKKWRTQEILAFSQPLVTASIEERTKSKHPLLD